MSDNEKKVAVIILNWNGASLLRRYLPSVVENTNPEIADVIVADNGSSDESLTLLSVQFPKVKTVLMKENYGFAEGYNRAVKATGYKYTILLNSDVRVPKGWVEPLLAYMEAHPEVGACQPKLLKDYDGEQPLFEYAGAAGGFLDCHGYPYCRGRIFDTVEQDQGQYDEDAEILWATGACLMIRSADFWRAGGFDGRFFAHNEEIDLCWRLHDMGRKIYCYPDSEVVHVGGGTLPKNNPMKTYLNFRNNLTMLYKNLPESDFHYVLRMRWLLDYVAAVATLLMHGNWGDFKAIFRARRAYRKWRHQFDDDRRTIQQRRVADGRKPFCIVWKYYIKKVTTYDNL